MDHTKARSRRDVWTAYRSALALALAAMLALTSASWMLGTLVPRQAEAAETKTVTDVYGVTRSELVSWLKSHEKDKYYLTTPYKPYDWRSPKGDINHYGVDSDGVSAGMNCTGFVWHALCYAHGRKDGITEKLPAITGWAEAIVNNSLENYTFSTKKEMLASKKLEKGDIIWMWDGDSNQISDFHHIGIFWGDKSNEDIMWHSSGDASNGWSGINEIGEIHGKASNVSYQVVKLGGKLSGGIELEKKSADESVTKGNESYSLKGAVYGVFNTKEDAESRAEKKAIKTYATNANGKFASEQEFDAGTYFVTEITAPRGYALNDEVYKVEVVAGQTVKVSGGAVKETPLLGGLKLVKLSANPSITDGNGCYSLKGAVYGVFASQADAATHDAGKASRTYETGEDGTFQSGLDWAAGTYYVAETSAPAGYALAADVYETAVKPGEYATVNGPQGSAADAPVTNPVTLWAAKQDAETADKAAQGSATLGQAQFEIAYYDGYYESSSLPATPLRTWVVATDVDGKAYVRDDLKVSGDDFYRLPDGRITIPLGTVTVREKEPPWGYLVGDGQDEAGGTRLMQIRPDSADEELGVYTAPDFSDHVKRGGVMIGKIDRQNGRYLPQGAATLAGAVFQIATDNDQQVIVGGTRYAKGDVVGTIETAATEDGRFIAQTADDMLPVGTYTLTEVETSTEGYLLDDASRAWSKTFEITENKQVVDLTDPIDCVGNQVIRGDFGFSKVDGQTDARLGLIPFMVTSQTTGERHVIMTDGNGMTSTATSWNAHSHRTNANDEAIAESSGAEGGFTVDEAKLDPAAGVWFCGRTDSPVDADDALGALPYDTYTVSELRVKNNVGYDLAVFTVRISRHARELDLGTVDDNPGPMIGTSLTDGNDVKLAAAGSDIVLTDTVLYTNLDMRETYRLSGELHLVGADGSDGGVISTGTTTFTPQGANGSVDVEFPLNTGDLAGSRLVAFERLATSNGDIVAVHEEITDEGQTVRVPTIGTTLTDAADGDHEAAADEVITLVDTVAYRGLTPGKTYVMSGALHVRADDGSDGGAVIDEQGRQVTASQSFTPNASEGQVEVVFSFAAPSLAGKATVAFEELTQKNLAYAVHADIADEGQTVKFKPGKAEKGQPKSVAPKTEKPAVEAPAEKAGKTVLPRTGDGLDAVPFAIAAAAALGLAGAALCIRSMQRNREITINRGPRHR